MALKIAIFGAGNGGVAAALEMTERGHEVTIHHDRTRMEGLDTLKKTKTATLNGKEISFHSFTNDASEAVAGKDVLMLTVPAFAIEDVAQSIVPHLEDDQMIYINSASALGALRFRNIMDAQDINKSVKVGDSMSLTYASR